MRELLAALRLVPMIEPPEPSADPDAGTFLIECPDGIMVYRDDAGELLPGVELDKFGNPTAGGVYVECGRQLARNGACQRCGGRSWVPAAPEGSSPVDLLARRETRLQSEIAHLVGGMD